MVDLAHICNGSLIRTFLSRISCYVKKLPCKAIELLFYQHKEDEESRSKKFWCHKNEGWGEAKWERKLLKKRWIISHFYDVTLSDFLRLQHKSWLILVSSIVKYQTWHVGYMSVITTFNTLSRHKTLKMISTHIPFS